ncbi:hypothetical protein ACFGVS_20395 [Mucilaginibacter sp. AW1-7]|uniref:hypothetical protein n=1 Tax=Mucilaginibacter sp. AW1-7 TaxID=3349874 RepID=UPI003F740D59
MNTQNAVWVDIRTIAVDAIECLKQIDQLYESAGSEGQRYFSRDAFPQKLEYSGGVHRTADMNKAGELIYLKNKKLQAKKWGKNLF